MRPQTRALRRQLIGYSVLFASGMWMSKVAQPLHYADSHALLAFGVGYAVMAIVGGLSFVWGALADTLGGLRAVRLGTLVYAIGIAGRVYTELLPSVVFSAVAGAGASLALVGIRPWIRSSVDDDELAKVVSGRTLGNQIGIFVGTVGAAALFFVMPGSEGHVSALVLAPVLVVVAALWLAVGARSKGGGRSSREASPNRNTGLGRLSAKLAAIGLLSGFAVSLVTPFLPVLLTESGIPDSGAAVAIAAMSLAQILTSAVLARWGMSSRPFGLFALAEFLSGAVTIVVGLSIGGSWALIVVLLVVRAVMVSISSIAEEIIQYAVIPGSAAGFVFGVSQTAFLAGDAIGGALGGAVWTGHGSATLTMIAGATAMCCSVLVPLLLRRRPVEEPVDAAR